MLTNKLSAARRVYTAVMRVLLLLAAVLTAALVVFMIVYVLYKGLPYVTWHLISTKPSYITGAIGILPDICNTMQILLASLLIVLPLGVGAAVYLTEYASNRRLIEVIEFTNETLAGIPSIIYGLVGMLVLVPGIRKLFHVPDGSSLLAAMIVLAIMILPSIIKVSVTALEAVPSEYEDASLALGATPVETWFRVSVPAARSGIAAAVVLGVGRAIGEAMAILMVAGNVANMPSLLSSVKFLTTAVASEMSYSSGLQQQALFSIALVLFLFIMLINAGLNLLLKRNKEG